MITIPLGKIVVANAGTPVNITLATIQAAAANVGATIPPSRMMHMEAWADPADTGASYIKSSTITVNGIPTNPILIASLPEPASGHCEHWHTCCGPTDPTRFSVDAAVNGDGPIVTLWTD